MHDIEITRKVTIYDTTLRDGAQGRGISFSLQDKLRITSLLADFGIPFIEGGWPGANPKDSEFFREARTLNLHGSSLVAFGSTRRKGIRASQDLTLQGLLAASTSSVALFGKSWTLHVEKVLQASLAENLEMIEDSIAFLTGEGRTVVYDAEHFFDGFRADQNYALSTLLAAARGGARWLVLCDTNGGTLPEYVQSSIEAVMREVVIPEQLKGRQLRLGIHAHNDSELAVANSLAAVNAGAEMVQGTMNGIGERCGNANLISVLANLELKMAAECICAEKLTLLTELSHTVSEIANLNHNTSAPFVGSSAFAHKAGVHASAVAKLSESYEHIRPEVIGNRREVLVSELSGRGNIKAAAGKLGIASDGLETQVLEQVKNLEARGYQFEDASASFELLLQRAADCYEAPFETVDVMVVSDRRHNQKAEVQAIVKLRVGGELMHTAASGAGPVHALDAALRKALTPTFPGLSRMRLSDFKVRILDPENATAAVTRVTIEGSCGDMTWNTVGCSENMLDACLYALADSFEYYLLKHTALTRAGAFHTASHNP